MGQVLPSEAPPLHRPGGRVLFFFPAPPPFFTTKNLRGPVRGMAGVGPWPGVGAGKEEKYTPAQAGERAGVGSFAGGCVSWGFGGPITNTTKIRTLLVSRC